MPVAAGACFLACFLISRFPPAGDRTTGELIAAFGVAGVLLLMAVFGQARLSRADALGMREVESFPTSVLESDENGLKTRLTLGQDGGRSSRPADDRLEVEADVSALGPAKVSARWIDPQAAPLPEFLTRSLDGLIGGGGVHWRDQKKAPDLASWPGWEFWGNPPEAAAQVFGRARPPSRTGAARLQVIGVRGGRLRCEFEGHRIDVDDLKTARADVRAFAERLREGGAPAAGPGDPAPF